MGERVITPEMVERYGEQLRAGERSADTVSKYLRDVRALAAWLGGREVTRELAAGWRAVFGQVRLSEMITENFRVWARNFFGFGHGRTASFPTCPA